MSRGKHAQRKRRIQNLSVVIAVIILIIFQAIILIYLSNREIVEFSRSSDIEESVSPQSNNDSIAIPGYEALTLSANQKRQNISLANPQENMCYFQISLYLEDGTLLWESELIAPGKKSKPIELLTELESGTYTDSVLHYSCYKMNKELTPLNGADMKLTLRVK